MATASAQLNQYRQSPRKVRLIADLVRGKKVAVAITELSLIAKRAGAPIAKLIASALANAKSQNLVEADLVVKEISVDGGAILYRRMPRSRGMANPIRKRTSHISVVLEEKVSKPKKATVTTPKK